MKFFLRKKKVSIQRFNFVLIRNNICTSKLSKYDTIMFRKQPFYMVYHGLLRTKMLEVILFIIFLRIILLLLFYVLHIIICCVCFVQKKHVFKREQFYLFSVKCLSYEFISFQKNRQFFK